MSISRQPIEVEKVKKSESGMIIAPITVPPEMTVEQALVVMGEYSISGLPVVEGDRLVGIVSRADVLRALSGAFAAATAPVGDVADADLLAAVRDMLGRQSWAPQTSLDIAVRDGVVELWGSILDERQREAIRVAVENVPGVKRIVDHLVWVEPFSGTVMTAPGDREA